MNGQMDGIAGSEFARLIREPEILLREAKIIDEKIETMCLDNYNVHIQNGACVANARSQVRSIVYHAFVL